jgi:hypothetical protein
MNFKRNMGIQVAVRDWAVRQNDKIKKMVGEKEEST